MSLTVEFKPLAHFDGLTLPALKPIWRPGLICGRRSPPATR